MSSVGTAHRINSSSKTPVSLDQMDRHPDFPAASDYDSPCAIAAYVLLVEDFTVDDNVSNGEGAITWCWKETASQMSKHPSTSIYDPKNCWIKYNDAACAILEESFQVQGKTGACSPSSGHVVDFATMKQRKVSTGWEREVQRLVGANSNTTPSVVWCWEETACRVPNHAASQIVGDPKDCMVRYDQVANDALERTYQSQDGTGECTPVPGYTVNFDCMMQTKIATGYQRKVHRMDEPEAMEQATAGVRGPKIVNSTSGHKPFFKRLLSRRSSDSQKN
jgi:hypothetical protein